MSDTPQVLLTYYLKTLRLPTFLGEFDKLARQCAGEEVDYPRYLLRLAELEMICLRLSSLNPSSISRPSRDSE